MTYPESLQKALRSGDLIAIRAALIAIVDKDKDLSSPQATKIADEVSADLHAQSITLFVADNGRFKLPPMETWTVDTWHSVKAAMHTNFSREKFIWADQVREKVCHANTIPPDKGGIPPSPETEFSSHYEITQPLKNAIKANDLIAIRSALIAIVDQDYNKPSPIAYAVALEVRDYLKIHNGISLFETDNGRLILPPPNEWTKDTWHGVKAAMLTNFSSEKFILADKILASIKEGVISPPPPPPPPPGDGVTGGKGGGHSGGKKTANHNQPSSMLITGGLLIIGGIVVGAIVAGTIGAIVGGGAGIAFSAKIIKRK